MTRYTVRKNLNETFPLDLDIHLGFYVRMFASTMRFSSQKEENKILEGIN